MSAAVAPPQAESALLSRLQSYTLVTQALGLYQGFKGYSPITTASLNYVETIAKRGIEVSIPVIKKVDEYAHIDERSVALLDVIETRAAQAQASIAKVTEAASHIQATGRNKLNELQLRGPVHQQLAANALELVSYSAALLHLDSLGDTAVARIQDARHTLFAAAASAATNAQQFVKASPTLNAVEQALEPYALAAKTRAEQTALALLTFVAGSVDLINHYFEARAADMKDVLTRAAAKAQEQLTQFKKEHPDWAHRLDSALAILRETFARSTATIQHLYAIPLEQLHTAFGTLYALVAQLQAAVTAFGQKLVSGAKLEALAVHDASAVVDEPEPQGSQKRSKKGKQ